MEGYITNKLSKKPLTGKKPKLKFHMRDNQSFPYQKTKETNKQTASSQNKKNQTTKKKHNQNLHPENITCGFLSHETEELQALLAQCSTPATRCCTSSSPINFN